MVKNKNFNAKRSTAKLSSITKKIIKSNAPLPPGRVQDQCKLCKTPLRATTSLHQAADERDPTLFCPSCGWTEAN